MSRCVFINFVVYSNGRPIHGDYELYRVQESDDAYDVAKSAINMVKTNLKLQRIVVRNIQILEI